PWHWRSRSWCSPHRLPWPGACRTLCAGWRRARPRGGPSPRARPAERSADRDARDAARLEPGTDPHPLVSLEDQRLAFQRPAAPPRLLHGQEPLGALALRERELLDDRGLLATAALALVADHRPRRALGGRRGPGGRRRRTGGERIAHRGQPGEG